MVIIDIIIIVDFKERNATVAQKWAQLSDVERKQWSTKAEIVCSESIQVSCILNELLREWKWLHLHVH